MNKLKDIIYDYSDVVAAVLIVVLTVGVVFWRVSAIMGYSDKPEKGNDKQTEVDISDIDLNKTDTQDPGNQNPDNYESDPENQPEVDPEPPTPTGEFVTKEEVKYTVAKGMTCTKIGKDLEEKGLIENATEFVDLAKELDRATKLQASTFTIPKGSTAEDIIYILSGGKKKN